MYQGEESLHELSYPAALSQVLHRFEVKITNHVCRHCLISLSVAYLVFD